MPKVTLPSTFYNYIIAITNDTIQKWNQLTNHEFEFPNHMNTISYKIPYQYRNQNDKRIIPLEIETNQGFIKIGEQILIDSQIENLPIKFKDDLSFIQHLLIAHHHQNFKPIIDSYNKLQKEILKRNLALINNQNQLIETIVKKHLNRKLCVEIDSDQLHVYAYNHDEDMYDIWLFSIDLYGNYYNRLDELEVKSTPFTTSELLTKYELTNTVKDMVKRQQFQNHIL